MDIYDQIHLASDRDTTLAHQLQQQLTWLIVNGRLRPGDRLPSVQIMADRLGINLHTVRSAYHKMEANGLVVTRQGRGTHVLAIDPGRVILAARDQISHTIGVILPSWTNPFYHGLLQGVQSIADEHQSLLFVSNTNDDPAAVWRDFYRLCAKKVDGILVVSHDLRGVYTDGDISKDLPAGPPVVTVDWPDAAGCTAGVDLESAGYLATRHLIEHGHHRIGLISYFQEVSNVKTINQGYLRALEQTGIPHDPSLMIKVPGFDMTSGEAGARRLLAMKNPPTALFTIADTLALGAMKTIKQAGMRIPQDIAVASFNDIPAAALVEPGLTTVSVPTVQLGQEAMRMLQTLIEGRQPPQRHITLPATLVIRQSCGDHAFP